MITRGKGCQLSGMWIGLHRNENDNNLNLFSSSFFCPKIIPKNNIGFKIIQAIQIIINDYNFKTKHFNYNYKLSMFFYTIEYLII